MSSLCTNSSMSIVRRGFESNVLELVLGDRDVVVLVDRIALDDVVVLNFVAALGVDLEDTSMRCPVFLLIWLKLILSAIRRGWIKRDRAGHERQAKKTLPIGAGGHTRNSGCRTGIQAIFIGSFPHAVLKLVPKGGRRDQKRLHDASGASSVGNIRPPPSIVIQPWSLQWAIPWDHSSTDAPLMSMNSTVRYAGMGVLDVRVVLLRNEGAENPHEFQRRGFPASRTAVLL